MTDPIGAVFIGTSSSVFVSRTRDVLCERGIPVVIVDPYVAKAPAGENRLFAKLWRMFQRYNTVKKEIRSHPANRTAVVHYLSIDCFWLIPLLAGHFDRVIGLAYGSDVLRRLKSRDFLLRFGLKRIDAVAATNNNVIKALVADFPFLASRPQSVIRFGLPVFDELLKIGHVSSAEVKLSLGFDPDRILVSLGYSASLGQRQIELIDFFAACRDRHKDCVFVVPVQYGEQSIIDAVNQRCATFNREIGEDQFIPLTDFHDPERSALMRRATDVLINHSVSDAFSGTVQEVIYAGNLVLAGDHLPYRNMPGFGSAIRTFTTLEEAASSLTPRALVAWQQEGATAASENRARLHATSSWDAVFPDWRRLIAGAPC